MYWFYSCREILEDQVKHFVLDFEFCFLKDNVAQNKVWGNNWMTVQTKAIHSDLDDRGSSLVICRLLSDHTTRIVIGETAQRHCNPVLAIGWHIFSINLIGLSTGFKRPSSGRLLTSADCSACSSPVPHRNMRRALNWSIGQRAGRPAAFGASFRNSSSIP